MVGVADALSGVCREPDCRWARFLLKIPFRATGGLLVKGILRLRLFFALIAQRTILAQDDSV
jgi:hypothetical protein